MTAGLRADGGRYVMYQWAGAPAGGGVEGRDGFHLIGHLITLGGLTLPNLETYEQLYPVRFRRQEIRCDTAGPGRFRGGAGCDYEVEMLTPADYAFRGEGVGAPSSFGAAGGGAGVGRRGDPHARRRNRSIQAPKYGVERHGPATYRALSPGGGGYGDPATREPASVLRDVRDGVVSAAGAERDYGVGRFTAAYIGWADSPFQFEVGTASLGFAVVGFLAAFRSFDLRLAAVLGSAVFLLGAAAGHAYQMVTAHNFAPGNAGTIFYTDIAVPLVGLVLLWLQHRWGRPG